MQQWINSHKEVNKPKNTWDKSFKAVRLNFTSQDSAVFYRLLCWFFSRWYSLQQLPCFFVLLIDKENIKLTAEKIPKSREMLPYFPLFRIKSSYFLNFCVIFKQFRIFVPRAVTRKQGSYRAGRSGGVKRKKEFSNKVFTVAIFDLTKSYKGKFSISLFWHYAWANV